MKSIDINFVSRVLAAFNDDGPSPSELLWRTDDECAPITFFVNCSDLFLWGCSDCEEITPDNIQILEQAVADTRKAHTKGYGIGAEAVFCCRLRRMRPQGACYDYRYFDKGLWQLFDNAGPERETGIGNPSPRPAA